MGSKPRQQTNKPDIVVGDDGIARCFWAGSSENYAAYHDNEWATPVSDDNRLFEKICLEGFQSGLSWLTILNKRPAFREVFRSFDPAIVATFETSDVERIVLDARIVRHRGKILSTINNAARALEMQDEFGSLAAYFWRWQPDSSERPKKMTRASLSALAKTPTSTALSKDLRKRGWSFVGPTTAYAFMQAMGVVNDHVDSCPARRRCLDARARFVVPQPS